MRWKQWDSVKYRTLCERPRVEHPDVVLLMHVTAAVDTPVVAIYGPTDYRRTQPLGELHAMEVDEVYRAVEETIRWAEVFPSSAIDQ